MKPKFCKLLFVFVLASTLLTSQAFAFENGQTATLVLGQADFTSNNSGTTASTLQSPRGIAFDSSGNLWVVDSTNNRVLRYDTPFTNGEAATLVLGQEDFESSGSGTTASTLQSPRGIAFDSSGNLWVVDSTNNRVLRYDTPFTNGEAATLVLGQEDFESGVANRGGNAAANTLAGPSGIAFDSSGNLWVSEAGGAADNHRVLRYDTPFTDGEAATLVLGQPDDGNPFDSSTANNGGISASTLNGPYGIAFDSSGNLWVSDRNNNRALRFDAPFTNSEAATLVIGQANFVSSGSGTTASTFNSPYNIAFDSSGNLWVSDGGGDADNTRVLRFDGPLPTTTTGDEGKGTRGDVSAPSFSLDISTIQRTLPDNIIQTIQEDPFVPIQAVKDPTVDLPLVINDNGYAITKYANTIQTNTIEINKVLTIKMNLSDETGIEHVALYTNLRGMQREISDSDTWIVFDEYKELEVNDPHELFYFADVTYEKEGTKYAIKFDIIFAKPMEKSDIIFRVWDEKRNSADTKIFDAWEVVTDIKKEPAYTMPGIDKIGLTLNLKSSSDTTSTNLLGNFNNDGTYSVTLPDEPMHDVISN
ncbi:MAG: NHL repeat-containing protein [Nitrosopumilaceae archaeon]